MITPLRTRHLPSTGRASRRRRAGLVILLAAGLAAATTAAAWAASDTTAPPAATAPRRLTDSEANRRIDETVAVTSRVLRETFPDVRITQEIESAFAEFWKATRTREILPCPLPHDGEALHLEDAPQADDGGALAVRPHRRFLPGVPPPARLDDPTLPPDDTLTTWVKVFEDLDEDGEYDAGEPGLETIQVSNGMRAGFLGQNGVALTAADGTHTFRTRLYESRFVFVTVPSGYTATTDFFHRLDTAVDPDSVYFGLRATPETADPVFRLVQMTDMQIANQIEEGLEHGDDLTEIESLASPPDFIVITGDLVQAGENEVQFQNYLAGNFGHDTIPVHHGYGDHDGFLHQSPPVALLTHNFETYIGPTCYSFEYGGIHFIMYNDIHAVDVEGLFTQDVWLFQDVLWARARNSSIPFVVCKHTMPGQQELDLYNFFQNMLGVFSGHWHGSRVRDVEGIFDVNTPPSRFAGIDKSSRGYRIIDMNNGALETYYREAGIVDHLQIVSPADGDTVLSEPVTILANAYGSTSGDLVAEFMLDGPAGQTAFEPMTQEGSWLWRATWDATGLPAGVYTLTVTVTPQNGAPFSQISEFELAVGGYVNLPDPYTDWPSYKFDAAGTGHTAHDLVPPLRLAWARNIGSPVNVPSPAVAGGRVFVGTSNISGTGQARMVCLDALTGDTVWELPARNDVKSTPAIHDGTLYFTNSTGSVFAVDAIDGFILWQAQLGDSLDRWEMTSPTYYDGSLYVGGGSAMAALDAATGDSLWEHDESLGYGDFFPSTYSAAAVNEDVAVFTNKFGIFAYDRLTGTELWKDSSTSRVHRSAAIVDTLVYTAGPGWFVQKLRAYDIASGALAYEGATSLYESTSAPVVGPGPGGVGHRVLVGYGGNENVGVPPTNHGRLQSFVPPGTSAAWNRWLGDMITTSLPYKRNITSINSTPAWTGNHAYFGADDGILYCIDPETGATLWSHDLGVPIRSSPAVAGNMLFVNGSDGTLYAFVSTYIDALGADPGGSALPLRTRLLGNAPNPFNPWTTIRFDLGTTGGARQPVALRIYDAGGRLVRLLVDDAREPGHHAVTWDGRNDAGREVASSVYFYRLDAGGETFTRKLVIAR